MRRISLGSILLFTAFGLAAGCTTTTSSRFNLFNRSKPTNEGCADVGAGPICEGPTMGGGMGGMPADSGYMLPGDGTLMPGTVLPSTGISTGPVLQGTGSPPNTNYMPPASGTSSVPPGRLVPQAPVKQMP
jgi:hypothetical protein